MFFLLLACATPSPDVEHAPPAPWYYASTGDDIDRGSIGFVGPEVRFHTRGDGLRSGALPDGDHLARSLACGGATRATLVLHDGKVADVVTVPTVPCVEAAAAALDLGSVSLDGLPVAATHTALLTLDVPTETLCSR